VKGTAPVFARVTAANSRTHSTRDPKMSSANQTVVRAEGALEVAEAVPKATAAGGLAVGTGRIGSGAAVPAATTRPIKRVEKQGTGPSIPAVNGPRTDMPEHKGSTLSEHRTGPAGSHPLGTARSRCSYHRTRSRVDSRWRLVRPSFVRYGGVGPASNPRRTIRSESNCAALACPASFQWSSPP
jgi:hypothetical protein